MRWLVLAGLLVSAVITYMWISGLDRFYVVDEQALTDPEFYQGLVHWRQKNSSAVVYEGSTVHIDHIERASETLAQKLVIDTPVFVRLSIDAGGESIVPGSEYWSGGSVIIASYSASGSNIGHNTLFTLRGTSPLRSYSEVIYLGDEVKQISVEFRLLRAKGRFSTRNPELSILSEFPGYTKAKIVVIGYWCLIGLGLLYWLVRKLTIKQFFCVSGLSVIAIVGVLVPGPLITNLNKAVIRFLPEAISNAPQQAIGFFFGAVNTDGASAGVSKFGHFLVFFLIGLLIERAFRSLGRLYSVALIAVFAVVTEVLQILVHGRSTSIKDVYIDLSGGVLGLVVGMAFVIVVEKIKSQPTRAEEFL